MQISNFKGIHNTQNKRSIPNDGVTDAVNVVFDDSGAVIQRNGYTLAKSMAITASYQSNNSVPAFAYATSGGKLYRIDDELNAYEICDSTATEFADYQGYLFTNDGLLVNDGSYFSLNIPAPIEPPTVLLTGGYKPAGSYSFVCTNVDSAGIEGSISPVYTVTLASPGDFIVSTPRLDGFTQRIYATEVDGEVFYRLNTGTAINPSLVGASGFPENADKIAYFRESIYVSDKVSVPGYTTIYFSLKHYYHLYDYNEYRLVIPGVVMAMMGIQDALIIATDKEIYAYDGVSLSVLANYGAIEGRAMVRDVNNPNTVFIYTKRGLCSALPFSNITESKAVLSYGSQCTATMIEQDNNKYVTVIHD